MAKRILILDDDEALLTMMEILIRKLGYQPVPVKNGWEAIKMVRTQPPDLILLDLMMRPMDGWQFLDEMQKAGLSKVPVMVFTAKFLMDSEREKYKSQIVRVLQKPADLMDLESILASFFAAQSAV
jgi:CheY-like chemotaxis protein